MMFLHLSLLFYASPLILSITYILEAKAFMQIRWRSDSPRTRTWFVATDLSRWQEIYCRRKLTDCHQTAASTKEITLHNYYNFLHIYNSFAASCELWTIQSSDKLNQITWQYVCFHCYVWASIERVNVCLLHKYLSRDKFTGCSRSTMANVTH